MAHKRLFFRLFLALSGLLITAQVGATPPTDRVAQTLLHTLDYVAVDYPNVVRGGKILDQAEYAEQVEFAGRLRTLLLRLPDRPEKTGLLQSASGLARAIERRVPGDEVRRRSADLAAAVIAAYAVQIAPASAPAPADAARLFEAQCSTCHGGAGYGDGRLAATMNPRPSNFHERGRQAQRSVYGLYSTITLGVDGTGMRSFADLSDKQRWALAFYVSNFFATDRERARGAALWKDGRLHGEFDDLGDLVQATPAQASAEHGSEGAAVLAYLRSAPDEVTAGTPSPLAFTRATLRQSLDAYASGETGRAYDLAVTAYLEGFELTEAGLSTVAPALKQEIERKMGTYRQAVKQGAPLEQLDHQVVELQGLLDEAENTLNGTTLSPAMAFVSSFIILLREGVEAILVLAAIAAFLIKTGRNDAMRYMHAGWISAIAIGLATWWAAKHLITLSGADREVTEGVTALFAAAMLVYVGFWLHNHTHAERWKQFIQGKLKATLGSGTLWSLTVIAFIAVYREIVETVLFYETLWLQTSGSGHNYLLAGLVSAAVALLAVAWGIFRFSIRLPLGLFFRANAALLFVLAVIFAGKGIAALQEAGKMGIYPINFPTVDVLGIYPTFQSIGLQLTLIAAMLLWLGYRRLQDR